MRQHVADRIQRLFGLAFLHEADQGIEHDDGENHSGVDPVRQRQGHDTGRQQHVDEHVVKLAQQTQQGGAPFRRPQAVGAVALQARQGLLNCLPRIDAAGGEDLPVLTRDPAWLELASRSRTSSASRACQSSPGSGGLSSV